MITIYRFGHYINTVTEDELPKWLIKNAAWTLSKDEVEKALKTGNSLRTSTVINLGYTFTSTSDN